MNTAALPKIQPSQQGMSLVSVLVGMTLSLLCITGSLALYKNLVQVSTEAQLDALHDGQLASALLTAQLEMQNAGYGITGPGNSHVALQSSSSEVNLYWRYQMGTQVFCRGLRDQAADTARELVLVNATNGCTLTANLTDLSYNNLQTLAEFKRTSTPVIAVTLTQKACWPFGAGKIENHFLVTITASTAAKKHNAAQVPDSTYSYCLPNIYPT